MKRVMQRVMATILTFCGAMVLTSCTDVVDNPVNPESPYDPVEELSKETDDAELKAISADMDKAFGEAMVHYRDVSNSQQHLDHYTLSVCLMSRESYIYDYKTNRPYLPILNNYHVGYEQCDFHKLTGWGRWLNTNQQELYCNPQQGGGGKLE